METFSGKLRKQEKLDLIKDKNLELKGNFDLYEIGEVLQDNIERTIKEVGKKEVKDKKQYFEKSLIKAEIVLKFLSMQKEYMVLILKNGFTLKISNKDLRK